MQNLNCQIMCLELIRKTIEASQESKSARYSSVDSAFFLKGQ